MERLLPIAAWACFFVATGSARAAGPVAIRSQGWTVTADPERSVLGVSQENLGVVLQDVRINLEGQNAILPLTGWSVKQTSQSQLTLRTAHPMTVWIFEISPNMLKISSTATNALLTAEAPAPSNRIPARLLDPQGFPVDWIGTDEAPLEYGGPQTRNHSFLPAKNPEVMYFALGPVSGSAFHSLFDRKQDAVIQFSDQTTLRRTGQDPSLMDVNMPVPGNTYIRFVPDYYTKTLGVPFYVPFDDSYFKAAPMVWSSWTGYYKDVTENDIVRNTDWLAKNLKPYGFQFVQLDDGFDRGKDGEHYWIENWDKTKFPHGPEWLTNYIKSKGFHAGLWIVPNVYAGALTQHPEWYLRSVEGDHIPDYHTPVLDSSNPEVVDFLRKLFATLDKWGFEYYKFDGEGSIPLAFPELDKDKLYDKFSDPVVVYRNRMKVIRDTIGPKVFLEGCPAGMPLNGVGYFNSFFNGNDLYNNWQGMYSLFSSINGNAFSNHIFAYVMPGEGIELGKPMTIEEARTKRLPDVLHEIVSREDPATGVGVTEQEARTIVSFISLTGVAYPVGNVMADLPQERLKLLQQTMPTMPIIPLDLFSRGTDSRNTTFRQTRPDSYIHNYPEILDLKVNETSGTYDVVGFTNWRSEAANRKISLRYKLGLDPSGSYVAFDFWNQKVLGIFSDQIAIDIEPHDTRVLAIHPVLRRPQLIGNSRHITGAFSIVDQQWDQANNKLSGSSETVPDEPYSLWFYLPKGFSVEHLSVVGKGNEEIAEKHSLTGNALMVSFQGQKQPVRWEVNFRGSAQE
jgi:Melibiase/Alpha galactosidase C-terminal beta sandwich domain